MPRSMVPESSQPCIWMGAGLLAYKLCDRDFDCERCPLDAGLRGVGLGSLHHESLLCPTRQARVFPADRLYSLGHSWVQAASDPAGRQFRFGLDTFAAALIGRCEEVNWCVPGRACGRGEPVCQIDLGLGGLALGCPFPCRVNAGNPLLRAEPGRLVTAPYSDGWILELTICGPEALDGLLKADAAREQARLDLQWFRRRVALHLFSVESEGEQTLPDGGELFIDLRQMLGGPIYMNLVRDLVH